MLVSFMESRFGIPTSEFYDYLLFERSRSWWLLRDSLHLQRVSTYKIFACGVKAFHRVGRFIKPTTRLIQILGPKAEKSVVALSEEELSWLGEGKGFQLRDNLEDGYVILTANSRVLGLGLSIRGWVRPQIRKGELDLHHPSSIP